MEILALVLWLILAPMGLVLLPVAVTAPGAAIAALAAMTGVVFAVLWIVLDAAEWTGWVQFGLAVAGMIGGGLAVSTLVDDRSISGSALEETGAAVLGLALPFYAVLILTTLLMATGAVDAVV